MAPTDRIAKPRAAVLARWRRSRVLDFQIATASCCTVMRETLQHVEVYSVHLCVFLSKVEAEAKGGNPRRFSGPFFNIGLYLLYLSTEFLWWQAVVGIIGGISSNALRINAQCTWRRSTGLPNVYNTAIRRALSPLRLCGSVTAEVHGCPRGVAPLRPSSALRDNPVARPGGSNNPIASPFHGMRCPPASPLFASWPWPRHHAILVGTH
jgi:hypothetical protein